MELNGSTRRSVLGGIGAIGVGALAAGSVTAGNHDGDDENGEEEGPPPLEFPPEHLTEWGEAVEVGNGEFNTFVTHNDADMPILVGCHFTADALSGLSDEHEHFAIDFPGDTEFEWFGLDWGPMGHGPPEVYDIPHFDIHYYLIPEDEVREIPAIAYPPGEDPDAEPYMEPLATDQFPPNYIRSHAVVPEMGEHLFDITSPEWSEGEFSNTFVWGHWEGSLNFYEPMITVDYLEELARGSDRAPFREHIDTKRIAMPDRMPEDARYPTEYTVRYHQDQDAYTVTLELFKPFDESDGVDE